MVGIGMTPRMRPGVLLPPRARTGPVASAQKGHTLASRSIRARQCGHMRTVLLGMLSFAPQDEEKTFLSRCHWNHSFGRKDIRGPFSLNAKLNYI